MDEQCWKSENGGEGEGKGKIWGINKVPKSNKIDKRTKNFLPFPSKVKSI